MNSGITEVEAELATLRRAAERVTNGLQQMLEIQATHTGLLQMILAAATAPVEAERELAQTLEQVLEALGDQTKILAQIHETFSALGKMIAPNQMQL